MAVVLILGACQTDEGGNEGADTPDSTVVQASLSDEQLAHARCQSCHAYPRPELLDRRTWKNVVLPRMGHRMGIYEGGTRPDSLFESGLGGELVREANIFPEEPTLPPDQWERIVEYYLRTAPTELPPPPDHPEISTGLEYFRVQTPAFRTDPPMTTLVEVGRDRNLFLGDAKGTLTILGSNFRERFTMDIPSAPAALERMGNRYLVTMMGSVPPTDNPTGRIVELALRLRTNQYKYSTLIDSLHRPVYAVPADLNRDGRQDLVVNEFGWRLGSISWFENRGGETYRKHVLRDSPGAIRSVLRDFDGDGRQDIVALIAQGDEGVYLYRNEGGGQFEEERLLRFPPSYGSTHFQLVDFNQDGAVDILHVAGDNADYEPVMKPYHGVRIFLNDGQNVFSQEYFYPLNGAYDAIADDYDEDGDLDIAAISFFPDYDESPEESFVYLENTGQLEFEATTFPNSARGRWLALDSGDLDNDGDTDLVLGSFSALQLGTAYVPEQLAQRWTRTGGAALVLENTIR